MSSASSKEVAPASLQDWLASFRAVAGLSEVRLSFVFAAAPALPEKKVTTDLAVAAGPETRVPWDKDFDVSESELPPEVRHIVGAARAAAAKPPRKRSHKRKATTALEAERTPVRDAVAAASTSVPPSAPVKASREEVKQRRAAELQQRLAEQLGVSSAATAEKEKEENMEPSETLWRLVGGALLLATAHHSKSGKAPAGALPPGYSEQLRGETSLWLYVDALVERLGHRCAAADIPSRYWSEPRPEESALVCWFLEVGRTPRTETQWFAHEFVYALKRIRMREPSFWASRVTLHSAEHQVVATDRPGVNATTFLWPVAWTNFQVLLWAVAPLVTLAAFDRLVFGLRPLPPFRAPPATETPRPPVLESDFYSGGDSVAGDEEDPVFAVQSGDETVDDGDDGTL